MQIYAFLPLSCAVLEALDELTPWRVYSINSIAEATSEAAIELFAVFSSGAVDLVDQLRNGLPSNGSAYVEGRFGGDAGSGKRKAAAANAPWSGRCAAGLRRIAGSTITFAPIFTRS